MGYTEEIIAIIQQIGNLGALRPDDDIYEKGFASPNALQLLLEIEDRFAVALPDSEFIAARTAQDLDALVKRLKVP